jgi:hypothetical protein
VTISSAISAMIFASTNPLSGTAGSPIMPAPAPGWRAGWPGFHSPQRFSFLTGLLHLTATGCSKPYRPSWVKLARLRTRPRCELSAWHAARLTAQHAVLPPGAPCQADVRLPRT